MLQQHSDSVLDDSLRTTLNTVSKASNGQVQLGGSVSYVQQVPWIQNKTIRDNILFGLPLIEEKYNK